MGKANFSFNKPAGACPTCTGLGTVHQANLKRLVNEDLSIVDGAVYGWDNFHIRRNAEILRTAGLRYSFTFDPALPVRDYTPVQRDLLFFGEIGERVGRGEVDVREALVLRGAAVAGRDVDELDARRLGELPGECVFATAGTDDE